MGSFVSTSLGNREEDEKPLLGDTSKVCNIYGVFLPLTYSLNNKNDKHVTVAVMGCDQTFGLSLSFTASQKRVVLPHHIVNNLRLNIDQIRLALEKRTKTSWLLRDITEKTPSLAVVKPIFGRWYVQICDANDNRICLSNDEWTRFERYLPSISRYMIDLWRDENDIIRHIDNHLHSDALTVEPIGFWWGDRLYDEVNAYISFANASKVADIK